MGSFSTLVQGAVLFPIAWSIKHLKEATQADGKATIVLK